MSSLSRPLRRMVTIFVLFVVFLLLLPLAIYGGMVLLYGREGALEKLFFPVKHEAVELPTLQLKASPNQYLVCPEGYCAAEPHAKSQEFNLSAEELRDRWFKMMDQQPRTKLLARDDETLQYDFEQRTPVILFPDTITVRFLPLGENRSTLAIYSRSHYGHSDLGENRRRIAEWLAALGVS